jgi:hypothetical protein
MSRSFVKDPIHLVRGGCFALSGLGHSRLTYSGTEHGIKASFEQIETASWRRDDGCFGPGAHTPPLGTLQKTRSQIKPGIWRGRAWHGRAGQAFELVESGVVDRATANSSLRTTTGHKQDDQTAKTKPPAGSCSRILDQSLGSTRARSSRNRPLEQPCTMRLGCARVDWTSQPLIAI